MANRELFNASEDLDRGKVKEEMVYCEFDLHFNTPQSPHMGAGWERLK